MPITVKSQVAIPEVGNLIEPCVIRHPVNNSAIGRDVVFTPLADKSEKKCSNWNDFCYSRGWSQRILLCGTFDMNSVFCNCFIEEKIFPFEEFSFESESWE